VDIQYLKVKWSYVMKGLRNEPGLDLNSEDATTRGVEGIRIMMQHAFGMHDECTDHIVIGKDGKKKEWCTFKSDPDNFKCSIKGGKPLEANTPPGHFEFVKGIVCGSYGSKVVVKMLMHRSSTNDNESFHAMIVSTVAGGKRNCLGARSSYYTSAYFALACKNDGHMYIGDLYEAVGMEAPEATMHQAQIREQDRTRCGLRKILPQSKQIKRDKKEIVSASDRSGSMVKLGKHRAEKLPSYKSGCLLDTSSPIPIPLVVSDDSEEEFDGVGEDHSDVDSVGSGRAPDYDSGEDEVVGEGDIEVRNALDKFLMPHQVGNSEAMDTIHTHALLALIEARRAAAMDN
jgi:hypothetical protein